MAHRIGIGIISGILIAVALVGGCKNTGNETPEPSPGPAIETPSEG